MSSRMLHAPHSLHGSSGDVRRPLVTLKRNAVYVLSNHIVIHI
jgi:hypothetical protein